MSWYWSNEYWNHQQSSLDVKFGPLPGDIIDIEEQCVKDDDEMMIMIHTKCCCKIREVRCMWNFTVCF